MGSYFSRLVGKKETRLLMNGLDGAGKTTILYLLKLGDVVTTIPTIGFNVETVKYKSFSLTTWDVGGRDKIRPLFRHYYPNTDAMVFIIDSSDRERLEQIADELMKALQEDVIKDAVFLILANKQDLESAMSLDEIKKGLNYDKIKCQQPERKIDIFGCSAVTEEGQHDLYRALDWLCEELYPPKSSWWSARQVKSGHKDSSAEGASNTDVNKTEQEGDKEKTSQDKTGMEKWTLGSYMKGTFLCLKGNLPSLW